MDNPVADFHIHSRFSSDAMMSPETIVKRAKKAGIGIIAVTDHETIRGGIRALEAGKKAGIRVIPGAEIRTDRGDIIGLHLNEEIRSTGWQEVIDGIRSQGGIVVLPHPYRDHLSPEEIGRAADFIEVWNSRCTGAENEAAFRLAERLKKKGMYGSDAHGPAEIGLVRVRVDPVTFSIVEVISARPTSAWNIKKSIITGHLRRGEWRALVTEGAGFLWKKIA